MIIASTCINNGKSSKETIPLSASFLTALAVLAEKRDGKIGSQHYNSQAALFGQSVKEMTRLLELIGGKPENIIHGAGDLYVTIFGGRTRKIGTLLGRGLSFNEAMAELQGVTLESIVISTRTARAVRKLAERGIVSLEDFPLLMHVDAIINPNRIFAHKYSPSLS